MQHNEDGDRYELIEGETSSTLSLINVQESGEYKCEAWDKNGDFAEADISIWVNSGLELEYDSSMIFAMPGEEVTVSVEAVSGVTSPDQITYQWYWENRQGEKTILTGETFNTLTFTAECTGSYYCEVNDSYMTKTAYFDVEIDSGLYVADTEIHREVKPGESITVQVDAIVSIGGLSYVWSKYNSETDSYEELEETGSSLTVIGGEVNDELTCQVQDDYGNTQTVFISLLVIGETAPDFESAVELNQGDKKPASIAEEEGRMYFKIVPESSGEYSFSSKGYFDTFARLYDENQNQLAENDDGGSENNFMITYNLEAGQTYYLEVSFYSENKTGSFYVVMEKEGECTHQWEYINVVPATCTTSGTRTPVCTQCGLTLESEVYQTALGHSAGSWEVSSPATCTAAGEKVSSCTRCGAVVEKEAIGALGHSAGSWKVTRAATCTAAGEKVSSCTRCGAVVEKEAIGALGHSAGSWKVTRAATCTAAGEKVSSCTRCGAVVKKEAVPATGHKLGGWTVKSKATVFAKESQSRRCSACGYTENRTVGSKLKPTIKVSASTIVLKVKQSTTKLKVSGLAAGDSVKSWKSSNTKIVTVSSKGKLTAKSKTGKATITITLASGLKKKVTVKVQKGTVTTTKISGLKKKITLAKGKKQTLKPVITPITSQQKVKYSSSNKSIVSVSSKGVLTAKKSGTARITVASGSKKVTITVVVPKTKTTAIKGVPSSVTIKKGKTYRLKAKRVPSNSEEKLTYKTSNKKIATVSSKGVITAKKVGTAKITVTSGKKKVTVKVVVPKTKTKTIKGVPSSLTMRKGKTYTLKAKRSPSGSDEKLTYKSSNKSIVTVSSSGKLRAKKKGTATITVTSGTVSVKCKVKVK